MPDFVWLIYANELIRADLEKKDKDTIQKGSTDEKNTINNNNGLKLDGEN